MPPAESIAACLAITFGAIHAAFSPASSRDAISRFSSLSLCPGGMNRKLVLRSRSARMPSRLTVAASSRGASCIASNNARAARRPARASSSRYESVASPENSPVARPLPPMPTRSASSSITFMPAAAQA